VAFQEAAELLGLRTFYGFEDDSRQTRPRGYSALPRVWLREQREYGSPGQEGKCLSPTSSLVLEHCNTGSNRMYAFSESKILSWWIVGLAGLWEMQLEPWEEKSWSYLKGTWTVRMRTLAVTPTVDYNYSNQDPG
jgi:hypothetical protein